MLEMVWIFVGQTTFHVVQLASGLFAEEFHLLLASWAPMGTKKFGPDLVELLGEFNRSLC